MAINILNVLPMPKGIREMENASTTTAMQAIPKYARKAGNYSVARSSSSQSAQISLHKSSAAHHASRFRSCRSLPTSLDPLNVTIKPEDITFNDSDMLAAGYSLDEIQKKKFEQREQQEKEALEEYSRKAKEEDLDTEKKRPTN